MKIILRHEFTNKIVQESVAQIASVPADALMENSHHHMQQCVKSKSYKINRTNSGLDIIPYYIYN